MIDLAHSDVPTATVKPKVTEVDATQMVIAWTKPKSPFSKSSKSRLAKQPSGKTSEFVIFVMRVILCWFCRL